MNPINKRIRARRIELNKTASHVANGLNIPVSTYRDWEYGRAIRVEYLIPLSQILNMPLLELLSGEKIENEFLFRHLRLLEDEIGQLKKYLLTQV